MQNPFLRFKHYRTDQQQNDPKENHATESLAACLVFSDKLRAEFLNFLFCGSRTFTPEKANAFEVASQWRTDTGKWVDLLMEQQGICAIVVEVKVGAPEDERQIREYWDWLKTKKGEVFLFSLVRSPNRAFHVEQYGGTRRRTWAELYEWLISRKKDYADSAEGSLLANLYQYLEAEEIVSTWNPKDILKYGDGIRAKNALQKLFEQVETRLSDLRQDYEMEIIMKDTEWPRLEIGKTAWSAIFGKAGYHNKLYVYYQTEAVWNGDRDGFYFEVQLWNKFHACDWEFTKNKVKAWIPIINKAGLYNWVILKGQKELDSDVLAYDFPSPPNTIGASFEDDAVSRIFENEIVALSNTALLDLIMIRIARHVEIISALP